MGSLFLTSPLFHSETPNSTYRTQQQSSETLRRPHVLVQADILRLKMNKYRDGTISTLPSAFGPKPIPSYLELPNSKLINLFCFEKLEDAIEQLLIWVYNFLGPSLERGELAKAHPERKAELRRVEARLKNECHKAATLLSRVQEEYETLAELCKQRRHESIYTHKNEYWAMWDARVKMFRAGMLVDAEEMVESMNKVNEEVSKVLF